MSFPIDAYLARELRLLYLELPNDGDFLLVSQFLDMAPDHSTDEKARMGVDSARLEPLFDVLGRWHVSSDLTLHLKGLLTESECTRVASILKIPCMAW
jgi:hypothetical protein